jgi:hypothetical protein
MWRDQEYRHERASTICRKILMLQLRAWRRIARCEGARVADEAWELTADARVMGRRNFLEETLMRKFLALTCVIFFSSGAMAQSTDTKGPATTGPAAQSGDNMSKDSMSKGAMSKKKMSKSAKMKKTDKM